MKIIHTIRGTASVCAVLLLSAFALLQPLHAAPITDFDDIEYWVGTGSNQAALVIQWNDGYQPVSLAWGFRWDDSATTEDMLTAIAGTVTLDGNPSLPGGEDLRLSLQLTSTVDFGNYVEGIAYDQAGLGGFDQVERTQTGYNPETFSYWAFFISSPSASWPVGGTFSASDFGITSTILASDTWYGFSYTEFASTYDFATPIAAVPEPGTFALLAAGAAVLVVRRLRRRDA